MVIGDLVVNIRTLGARGAQAALERVDVGMAKTGIRIVAFNQALSLSRQGLRALGAAFESTVGPGREFEKSLARSTAIMGDLNGKIQTQLRDTALVLSQEFPSSANDAAKAYFFLASAGLDAESSMAALPEVMRFATAGAFDLATATDLLTDAQSALGLTIRDDAAANVQNMVKLSDALVIANTKANASVQQFSEALQNKGGAAARVLNRELGETLGVLGALADQGTKGSGAGDALNQILRDLPNAVSKAEKAWEKYNLDIVDGNGNLKNMADITDILTREFTKYSAVDLRRITRELKLQDRSIIRILQILGTGQLQREIQRAVDESAGATADVAGKQIQNVSDQFQLFKNQLDNLKTNAFDEIDDDMKDLIKRARDFLDREGDQLEGLFERILSTGVGAGDAFLFMADSVSQLGDALAELDNNSGAILDILLLLSGVGGGAAAARGLGRLGAKFVGVSGVPRGVAAAGTIAGGAAGGAPFLSKASDTFERILFDMQSAAVEQTRRIGLPVELLVRSFTTASQSADLFKTALDQATDAANTRRRHRRLLRRAIGAPTDVDEGDLEQFVDPDSFLGRVRALQEQSKTANISDDVLEVLYNELRELAEGPGGFTRPLEEARRTLTFLSDRNAGRARDAAATVIDPNVVLGGDDEAEKKLKAAQRKLESLLEKTKSAEEKLADQIEFVESRIGTKRADGTIFTAEQALDATMKLKEGYEAASPALRKLAREEQQRKDTAERLTESIRDQLDPQRAINRQVQEAAALQQFTNKELLEYRKILETNSAAQTDFQRSIESAVRGVGDDLSESIVGGFGRGTDGALDIWRSFSKEVSNILVRELLVMPLLDPIIAATRSKGGVGSLFTGLGTLAAPRSGDPDFVGPPAFQDSDSFVGPQRQASTLEAAADVFKQAGDKFLAVPDLMGDGLGFVFNSLEAELGGFVALLFGSSGSGKGGFFSVVGEAFLRGGSGAVLSKAAGKFGNFILGDNDVVPALPNGTGVAPIDRPPGVVELARQSTMSRSETGPHTVIHQNITPTTVVKAFSPREMADAARANAKQTTRIVRQELNAGKAFAKEVGRRR